MKSSFARKPISILLSLLMLLTAWVFVTPAALAVNVGDTIQFGTYPQSQVTDADLIDALAAAPKAWASYGYYSSPTDSNTSMNDGLMAAGDWMRFADFSYNGQKYRAVVFDGYRPKENELAQTADNSFQDDNGYDVGTVYYFLYEPLIWRVLDPDTGLVLCERVIDAQAFHNYTIQSSEDSNLYGDPDLQYYANNYARSSVRAWLNHDFYETAFTNAQKENIPLTELDNSAYNTSTSQYACETTTDKIFFLTYKEANSKYGFTNITRLTTGTPYAHCQGDREKQGYSDWWLRTPGTSSKNACLIQTNNELAPIVPNGSVIYAAVGVRPACRLSSLTSDPTCSNTCFSCAKAGHTPGNAVTENNIAPDCTTAGSYDSVIYCTICGAEYSRETVTVPANGHTTELVNAKAATATENGYTGDEVCTVCGVTVTTGHVIPATGQGKSSKPGFFSRLLEFFRQLFQKLTGWMRK